MKLPVFAVSTLIMLLVFATASRAEKDADLRLRISTATKNVMQEKFDGAKLPKSWMIGKGDFQVRDGAIVGWEKKEDMHAAVLTLQKPFKNSILRFSFKRDGATGFNVSFNHAKGHLFRVLINEDSLTIIKDKDKNDANSKQQVLGKAEGKFPSGQWQTLQLEIVGDRVAVSCDNGVKLEAKDSGLEVEKTGYRFVMRGSTLYLDEVNIWEVQ